MEWKTHIELTIPKTGVPATKSDLCIFFSDMTTLKMIYFAHFHSITEYGIILWDNFYKVGKLISYKRKL